MPDPFRFRPGIALVLGMLLTFAAMGQSGAFINHLQKARTLHKNGDLSEARQHAVSAQKSAATARQREQAASVLDEIDRSIVRHRAAARLAQRLANDGEPAEAQASHEGDVDLDAERLSHTLQVFTRDRGGKVVTGTLSEFQCRGGNPRLVVTAENGSVTVEIDDPGNILITQAGEHHQHFDFRCGKQKSQAVRIGYHPASKDGRVGFLRILEFQAGP